MADQRSLLFLSTLYHLDNNRETGAHPFGVTPVFYFYAFLSTAFSFVLLSVPAPVGNQRSLAEWKSNWAGVGSEIKCKLLIRSALPLIREGDGYKVEDALVLSYVFLFLRELC